MSVTLGRLPSRWTAGPESRLATPEGDASADARTTLNEYLRTDWNPAFALLSLISSGAATWRATCGCSPPRAPLRRGARAARAAVLLSRRCRSASRGDGERDARCAAARPAAALPRADRTSRSRCATFFAARGIDAGGVAAAEPAAARRSPTESRDADEGRRRGTSDPQVLVDPHDHASASSWR